MTGNEKEIEIRKAMILPTLNNIDRIANSSTFFQLHILETSKERGSVFMLCNCHSRPSLVIQLFYQAEMSVV